MLASRHCCLSAPGHVVRTNDSRFPPDDGEPCLGPAFRKAHAGEFRVYLDPGWVDGFNLPAVGKGLVQFLPRHPPRTFSSRFLVAETHEEHQSARLDRLRQPLDVAAPVVVAEHMEKSTVDHTAEALSPFAQCQSILDEELHRQSPLGSLVLCPTDRLLHIVDARHVVALACEVHGTFPRATSSVEDWAVDSVGILRKRRLWTRDVPWCLACVKTLEGRTVW